MNQGLRTGQISQYQYQGQLRLTLTETPRHTHFARVTRIFAHFLLHTLPGSFSHTYWPSGQNCHISGNICPTILVVHLSKFAGFLDLYKKTNATNDKVAGPWIEMEFCPKTYCIYPELSLIGPKDLWAHAEELVSAVFHTSACCRTLESLLRLSLPMAWPMVTQTLNSGWLVFTPRPNFETHFVITEMHGIFIKSFHLLVVFFSSGKW